jgi:cell division protein ZapA
MSTVQIRILGREYSLRSQQSVEQVQKIADFVEQKIAETADGRSVDTQDLTVLTLLNLAGQYLQLLEGETEQQQQLTERLQRLVVRLEHVNSGVDSGC